MFGRIVAVIALVSGCSSNGSGEDTPGGPCWDGTGGTEGGSIEIGTGIESFESLTVGQQVPVEPGFQGNHHVIVNVRMTGLEPGTPDLPTQQRPRTRITVSDADGVELDTIPCPYLLAYEDRGGGFVLPTGRLVTLADEVIPTIDGVALTIDVEVIDNNGLKASASIDVVAELIGNGGGLPDAGPDAS